MRALCALVLGDYRKAGTGRATSQVCPCFGKLVLAAWWRTSWDAASAGVRWRQ